MNAQTENQAPEAPPAPPPGDPGAEMLQAAYARASAHGDVVLAGWIAGGAARIEGLTKQLIAALQANEKLAGALEEAQAELGKVAVSQQTAAQLGRKNGKRRG